jgi:hypothetical protein
MAWVRAYVSEQLASDDKKWRDSSPALIDCVLSGKPSARSCRLAAVEVEQSAETRSTADRAERRVVVARRWRRDDDLAAKSLVVALGVVVAGELADQMVEVALAED